MGKTLLNEKQIKYIHEWSNGKTLIAVNNARTGNIYIIKRGLKSDRNELRMVSWWVH